MSGFISLGDAAQQGGQIAVAAGGTTAAAVAAGTAFVPFVGPIIAGVSLLVGWLTSKNAVYHAQEAAATKVVNAIEPAMRSNLAAYMSGQIDQATALANFDALWAQEEQQCGQIPGPAGQRCVTDRQAGACTWKNDGKGGPAGSGSVCWNWFVGYRTPIENGAAGAVPAAGLSVSSPLLWLGVGAGLLLLGNAS